MNFWSVVILVDEESKVMLKEAGVCMTLSSITNVSPTLSTGKALPTIL